MDTFHEMLDYLKGKIASETTNVDSHGILSRATTPFVEGISKDVANSFDIYTGSNIHANADFCLYRTCGK